MFFLRLKSGLAPLVNDASATRSELSKMEKKLEEKTGELGQLQQQIDASSKLLKLVIVKCAGVLCTAFFIFYNLFVSSIKSSISTPTILLSDKTGSIQTSFSLITSSSIFPALVVSVLLNLITGGFLLTTYSSSKRREDTQPAQFISPAYKDYLVAEPQPEEEKHFGDKMYRLEDTRDIHEDSDRYTVPEQRFDNVNMQDIYYELPRTLYI